MNYGFALYALVHVWLTPPNYAVPDVRWCYYHPHRCAMQSGEPNINVQSVGSFYDLAPCEVERAKRGIANYYCIVPYIDEQQP